MPQEVASCPPELEKEIRYMKGWFPYRIVWGYVEDGKPQVFAHFNKRGMNTAIRKGKAVFSI
jgi:hypothetical protein